MDSFQCKIILSRALRLLCPHCGETRMYTRWNVLHTTCPACGYELEKHAEDSWFFTYMTTAFFTGIIVLWMLLFPVTNFATGYAVLLIAWFALIVLTLPYRKAIALAIDLLIQSR